MEVQVDVRVVSAVPRDAARVSKSMKPAPPLVDDIKRRDFWTSSSSSSSRHRVHGSSKSAKDKFGAKMDSSSQDVQDTTESPQPKRARFSKGGNQWQILLEEDGWGEKDTFSKKKFEDGSFSSKSRYPGPSTSQDVRGDRNEDRETEKPNTFKASHGKGNGFGDKDARRKLPLRKRITMDEVTHSGSRVSVKERLGTRKRFPQEDNDFEQEDTEETDDAWQEASKMFEKKFDYKPSRSWALPSSESWFQEDHWEIDELIQLRDQLNEVKDKLNDKPLDVWRPHTNHTNRADYVKLKLKREIQPELMTQAWCKFFEIVSSFPIVSVHFKNLRTFHICEAPGAFITALNHYLKTQCKDIRDWEWLANSLNPYYEGNSTGSTVMDDWFIQPTLDRWFFGSDATGDIMTSSFLEDVRALVKQQGDFHLVTADGSIDCVDTPGEQEKVVSFLHYAEVIVALNVLRKGGNLVVKKFTLYECESVCLMYLLCCTFRQVSVFKPVTSKPGNSEVYVVCIAFKGRTEVAPYLHILQEHVGETIQMKAMFCRHDIPKDFLKQHIECCKKFKGFQEATILQNIEWFEKQVPEEYLESVKWAVADLFFDKYNVRRIKAHEKVVSKYLKPDRSHYSRAANLGTFTSRQEEKTLSWLDKLDLLESRLHTMPGSNHVEPKWQQLTKFNHPPQMRPSQGLPYDQIRSSRFCFQPLLEIWNQFMGSSKVLNKVIEPYFSQCEWDQIQKLIEESSEMQQVKALVCIGAPHSQSRGENQSKETSPATVLSQLLPMKPQVRFLSDVESSVIEESCIYVIDAPIHVKHPLWVQEIHSQRIFLRDCLTALKSMKEGHHLIVFMGTTFTRFTVALLYALSMFFEEMSSARVVGKPPQPVGIHAWMFTNFSRPKWSSIVVRVLDEAADFFDNESTCNKTVLEIASIRDLCREPFYSVVLNSNISYISSILPVFISLEKRHLVQEKAADECAIASETIIKDDSSDSSSSGISSSDDKGRMKRKRSGSSSSEGRPRRKSKRVCL